MGTRRVTSTLEANRSRSRYRVGIDENGLGARLGPLVVTAVIARVSERGTKNIDHWTPRLHTGLLGDSKQLVRHGDVRLGEAWARALAAQTLSGPSELLRRLSITPLPLLMKRCPRQATAQCWNDSNDEFLAEEELMQRVHAEMRKLRRLGIQPCHAVSRLVCTNELNARGQLGENRFLVDLHCMEELILAAPGIVGQPLEIVCGKVGGMREYTHHFGKLGQSSPVVISETSAASIYRVPEVGEVRFLKDADSIDPLVMLASLVGKYLRELFVSRIGSHFANLVDDLRKPSGYHDRVTQDFAKATAGLRRQTAFPSVCFERAVLREP